MRYHSTLKDICVHGKFKNSVTSNQQCEAWRFFSVAIIQVRSPQGLVQVEGRGKTAVTRAFLLRQLRVSQLGKVPCWGW